MPKILGPSWCSVLAFVPHLCGLPGAYKGWTREKVCTRRLALACGPWALTLRLVWAGGHRNTLGSSGRWLSLPPHGQAGCVQVS